MAQLRGLEPGDHPVVIVGSGPGGMQTSYSLARAGVANVVLSQDEVPGGMFQRFPLFQRLITWTKLHAPAPRGTRAYQWYDWNSLIADEPDARDLVPGEMDGTSYFPSRPEMARGLEAFAARAALPIRHGVRWEGTARTEDGFVVATNVGEYTCRALVIAVGMTEPWKPQIPGIAEVPHYVETRAPATYAGRRVFVIGKRNSGFEIADGLLPWASRIVLASPRPTRLSVLVHSTAAARARYLQPYEDHVLGGGNVVLDGSIERVERTGEGYRVIVRGTTQPGDLVFEADDVIAATGFGTPLGDLPEMGVATFYQGRLPAQTPYWESTSVPGLYFAGSITQGAIGLKKYGIPSNSAAVHGFRYNADVLARHIAERHFGVVPTRPVVEPGAVVEYLLAEATRAPELWHQQSYLARALVWDGARGITDDGIVPLAHFVDAEGDDAVAMTVETDPEGTIRPAVYIRRGGRITEHPLGPSPLHDFETPTHRAELTALLKDMIG